MEIKEPSMVLISECSFQILFTYISWLYNIVIFILIVMIGVHMGMMGQYLLIFYYFLLVLMFFPLNSL